LATPSTLVAKITRAWASLSPSVPVPAEIPALATTRSSGARSSAVSIQRRTATASTTSTAAVSTSAPAARQAASIDASRPRSRPPSTKLTPLAA
jgi:hypothetical protein